jgi:hypothetical protein
MRIIFLALCLSLFTTAHSTDRLEGIAGGMRDGPGLFSGWFSDDEKEPDEKEPDKKEPDKKEPDKKEPDKKEPDKKVEQNRPEPEVKQQEVKLANDLPSSGYYDEEAGCLKQKSYILDVENPENYKRIEDYPFTYECAVPR